MNCFSRWKFFEGSDSPTAKSVSSPPAAIERPAALACVALGAPAGVGTCQGTQVREVSSPSQSVPRLTRKLAGVTPGSWSVGLA